MWTPVRRPSIPNEVHTQLTISPDDIVTAAAKIRIGKMGFFAPAQLLDRILRWDTRFMSGIISNPAHTHLALLDPLVSHLVGRVDDELESTLPFDRDGRSIAGRYVEATLAFFRSNRSLATEQPLLLRNVLEAATVIRDELSIPGAGRGLYADTADPEHLTDVIVEAEGALSIGLATLGEIDTAWHDATIAKLKTGSSAESDWLQQLLIALKVEIAERHSDISVRVFKDVLSRTLRQSGLETPEATLWLTYAMSLLDREPELAMAIIYASKPALLGSKTLETAQNRLANSLTTIKGKQAPKLGISAIRLLLASAPPQDAAEVFLPQQRALFVLRHVSGWMADDSVVDLPEKLEYYMTMLCFELAPIVQDLSGAHWDTIFDLVNNGLDVSAVLCPPVLADP